MLINVKREIMGNEWWFTTSLGTSQRSGRDGGTEQNITKTKDAFEFRGLSDAHRWPDAGRVTRVIDEPRAVPIVISGSETGRTSGLPLERDGAGEWEREVGERERARKSCVVCALIDFTEFYRKFVNATRVCNFYPVA